MLESISSSKFDFSFWVIKISGKDKIMVHVKGSRTDAFRQGCLSLLALESTVCPVKVLSGYFKVHEGRSCTTRDLGASLECPYHIESNQHIFEKKEQ